MQRYLEKPAFLKAYVWVCAVRDGGGVKLYPVSPGYWIVVDVFLPWMIILPVGKTRGCCATSWHSVLPSFLCHLLPSVILCPHSSFSFQLPSVPPSLWDWRCALTTQRDSVPSGGGAAGRARRLSVMPVTYWSGLCAGRRGHVYVCISIDGKQGNNRGNVPSASALIYLLVLDAVE